MPAATRAQDLLGLNRSQIGRRLLKHEAVKFLLTTSAPALIQPEEATRLIDFVVDESELFRMASVTRMRTNELRIRYMDITGGILRLATCGQEDKETVDISNTNKCLRTVSMDAMFPMCDDDIEDNFTGAQLENQVLRMAADQMSNELEVWGLMCDTNLRYVTGPNSPTIVSNQIMDRRDGWYRQLQQGHPIDAGVCGAGQGGVQRAVDFDKMRRMHRAIPTRFRRNPAERRIFMPTDMVDDDWAALFEPRVTNQGDAALLGEVPLVSGRVPIQPLPLLPTDIQNCGCASLGSPNGTFVFETDPANIVLGIQRNITFEREREARAHETWYIWTFRADVLIFNEDATSMLDCMQLVGCGDECATAAPLAQKCGACINLGTGGEPF